MNEKQKEEPLLTHGTKEVSNASTDLAEAPDAKPAIRRRDPLNSPGLHVYDCMDDEGVASIGPR